MASERPRAGAAGSSCGGGSNGGGRAEAVDNRLQNAENDQQLQPHADVQPGTRAEGSYFRRENAEGSEKLEEETTTGV